jgi:hypothetical protein
MMSLNEADKFEGPPQVERINRSVVLDLRVRMPKTSMDTAHGQGKHESGNSLKQEKQL